MRRSTIIRAMVAAAATIMLAACGGGTPDAAAGGDGAAVASADRAQIDPCSLLSGEEMAAITTDAVTKRDRDGATCNYRSAPNDGVQVTVHATGGAAHMATVHQTAKLLGGMGASVAKTGGAGGDVAAILTEGTSAGPALGDEAVWQLNETLAVRKGDAFVEVSPPIMHDPANHTGYPLVQKSEKRAIAQAVAAKLLAKLNP